MQGHTILVVRGAHPSTRCDDISKTIGLPVIAFYASESDESGEGASDLAQDEAGPVARSLYDLYSLVALGASNEISEAAARRWATKQLASLKDLVLAAEAAATSGDDREMVDTAEDLRAAAEEYAFALLALDGARQG